MKTIWLLLAVALIAGVIGYHLGSEQGEGEASTTPVAEASPEHPVQADHPAVDAAASQNRFTHFRVGNNNVKAMYADGDLMWVGTSAGVIRYDIPTDRYQRFDTNTGLLANGVFYVGKLKNRLAVGTYGGGLALLKPDGNGWDIYNVPEGLADAFVYDVIEDSAGDIWIATWSGLNRVRNGQLDDPGSWETYTVENTGGGLPNDWVYALDMDAQGTLWLATEGGLARYRDGKWQNWQHEDGLGEKYELVRAQITFSNDPANYSRHHARQKEEMGLQDVDVAYNPNYIVALTVSRDGTVWCGTWGGGLARFDGENWQSFTMKDGLPGNHVFMLHEDQEGRLWVGTSSGLAQRQADGSYRSFTMRDGLFSDLVFSMAIDSSEQLWIGSFGGVARIEALH